MYVRAVVVEIPRSLVTVELALYSVVLDVDVGPTVVTYSKVVLAKSKFSVLVDVVSPHVAATIVVGAEVTSVALPVVEGSMVEVAEGVTSIIEPLEIDWYGTGGGGGGPCGDGGAATGVQRPLGLVGEAEAEARPFLGEEEVQRQKPGQSRAQG